jgi:hypothetical protein
MLKTVGNPATRYGDQTIINGNLVIGTSGHGIDFSATTNSGGTVTSELLDDYEEGTFTPTINQGLTTPTYITQSGWYTKIGNRVFFTIYLLLGSGQTRNADAVGIFNLPFAAAPGVNQAGGYFANAVGLRAAGDPLPTILIGANSVATILYEEDGNALPGTAMNTAGPYEWYINGSYWVA